MVERLKPKRVHLPKLEVPTTSDQVYRTERWMRLSRILRQRNRVCQECELDLSTEVHHVIPIEQAPHLAFDVSNLRCLCHRCHQAQHHSP